MNTKQMINSLLSIILAIFVIPAISANAPIAQTDRAAKQMPTGLWQAFSAAQHLIEPDQDQKGKMRFKGQNLGNHFNFSFAPKGISYRSNNQDTPWQLSMELAGYGTKEHQQSMPTKKMHLDGNRVTYDRGNVQEWYVNNTAGLEQGFTLKAPPSQAKANQQIVLDIKLSGNLSPRWQQQGQSLTFYTEKGDYAFNYAKLSVIDAEGKQLPAQMALVDNNLQLSFNPENASWPVIVDPLSYTETKLMGVDSDVEGNASFGTAVALDGNTAIIGAYSYDGSCNGTDINCGAAYVFTGSGNNWMLQQKITADDPTQNSNFGWSVALNGDTAVVGAYGDDISCSGTEVDCGSAYVYTRQGSTWTQQKKLVADDANQQDYFGRSIGLDGDTLVIGAYQDDGTCFKTDLNCGAAYIYTRTGTKWLLQQKLFAEDADASDEFGWSVALNGETVVIGAKNDDGSCRDTSLSCGASYVFVRTGSLWMQQQKLVAEDASSHSLFGHSVSVNGDTAVIGAKSDDYSCNGNGFDCGAAYIFTRSSNSWTQQQKIVAEDSDSYDYFGNSVTLDGDTVLVGAPNDDEICSGGSENCGAAYVFVRSGNVWAQQQKIMVEDAGKNDLFGTTVALNGDTVVIGSPSVDGSCTGTEINCGAAYVFARSGNTWMQGEVLVATSTYRESFFGNFVALDRNTALVSAYKDDRSCNGTDVQCGAVFVFTRTGSRWSLQQKLVSNDPRQGGRFGVSLVLEGDTALVGSDVDVGGNGTVYVFTRFGNIWSLQQKLNTQESNQGDRFGVSVALEGDTALIGAPWDNDSCSNDTDSACGAAYVYTRFGSTWFQQQKLIADDGSGNDHFGNSVALDGETAMIGSVDDRDTCITTSSGIGCGAVYVFTKFGNTWTQQQKLASEDPDGRHRFGHSIALDDNTALISEYISGGEACEQGRDIECTVVYLFTRSGNIWRRQLILMADDSNPNSAIQHFGSSLALDGGVALIGAKTDSCQEGLSCGAAYLYVRVGDGWSQQQKLSSMAAGFGASVALSGNTLLIGADSDGNSCPLGEGGRWCGSAYLYDFNCGFGKSLIGNHWTMVGLPCNPNNSTVEDIFADNLNPVNYGERWVVYERDYSNPDSYKLLNLSSTLSNQQQGLWVLSLDASVWDANGTATPIITNNANCPSSKGCYEIDLIPPALNTDPPRYNLLGHVFPYPIEWQSVRYQVDGQTYTPSQAEAVGLASKNMWLYNGNAYEVFDDATPGMEGELNSYEGLWTAAYGNATGSNIKLLLPVKNIISAGPPLPP